MRSDPQSGLVLSDDAPYQPVDDRHRHSLRNFTAQLFRDGRRIAVAFAVGLMATLIAAILFSPRYVSEATLLLRQGHEYIYKPETGDGGNAQPMAFDREQTLRAEVDILTSRDVAEAVLGRLGVEQLYPKIAWSSATAAGQHDATVLTLQKAFDAVLLKDSNVLHLKFSHADPQLAARALNTFIAVYLDRRRRIFNTASTVEVQADVDVKRGALGRIEQAIEALKQSNNIQSFGEQQSLLLSQRQAIETRQAESDLALSQAEGRSGALARSLAQVDRDVVLSTETGRNEARDGARKTLLDLRLKERDLSSRYTDDQPGVQDARVDIQRTEAFLRELEARPNVAVKTGRSPVRDGVEADIVRTQADRSQASASRSTLAAQHAAVDARLQGLAASALTLQNLERERVLAEIAYQSSSRRLQDETVLERLDQERKSNVSIVQSARPPLAASSVRLLVIGIGLFASLCLALLTALVSAAIRDTYMTPEEVRRDLGVPTLASVPRLA